MKCEICGIRDAKYTCINCGRRVCEECFNLEKWICIKCSGNVEGNLNGEEFNIILKTSIIGFSLIFLGIIIIMISQILMGGFISGGIIIFPFLPIPIIFLKDVGSMGWAMIITLAIIALILVSIFMYMFIRKI